VPTEIKTLVAPLNELPNISKQILEFAPNCKKFALSGELGTGKTTLTKSICQLLGVTQLVTSPTFSIINEYDGKDHQIWHLDLYRLKNLEEAINLNIEEYLDDENYCFIEWPEVANPLIPDKIVYIRIQVVDNLTRKYELHKHSL